MPGKPHPLAGKIFQLTREGYSQRQIAAMVELSQSTVQRVLSGPAPDDTDPDGVLAEFAAMAKAAQAENTPDAYRRLHKTALVCHANGYDVPWHALPYLMVLSAAADAAAGVSREALRAEISGVYADMRTWRDMDAG